MTAEEELILMASTVRRPYPPPESAPALFAIALELVALWESLRDAVLFMQFLGKRERPLTDSEQRWLDNAVTLLRKIENDDPQSALAERIKLALDRIESEGE